MPGNFRFLGKEPKPKTNLIVFVIYAYHKTWEQLIADKLNKDI